MTDRKLTGLEVTQRWHVAEREIADAAADAVLRLERVKALLAHISPNQAQAWFKARQACDLLYILTNKAE